MCKIKGCNGLIAWSNIRDVDIDDDNIDMQVLGTCSKCGKKYVAQVFGTIEDDE